MTYTKKLSKSLCRLCRTLRPHRVDLVVWRSEWLSRRAFAQVLVRTPVGTLQINSPLVGRQNVYNILAAVATGLATTVRGQPVPLKARACAIGSAPLCMRMECRR